MKFLDSLLGRQPKPNNLTAEANRPLVSPNPATVTPLPLDNSTPINPNLAPVNATFPTSTEEKSKPKINQYVKILRNVTAVIVTILTVLAIATFTSMDTILMKPYLSGQVVGTNNVPVAGAKIDLNGRSATTDNNGNYSINNLEQGTYDLIITANQFEKFEEKVVVDRTFLNYQNYKKVTLTPSGIATLTGKFVLPTGAVHNFVDDRVALDGKEYGINLDGSFRLSEVTTGEVQFEYRADNYQNIIQKIKLVGGENSLPEFKLVPTGDLVANTKSFLKEDIVQDLTVLAESVPPAQISIDNEGNLRVRDLEIGREYRVQIQHQNYATRQYTVTVKQGKNDIFGFRVVEKGVVPYLQKVENFLQLFVSDLDGGNPRQLTKERFDPYAEFAINGLVYFLSPRDNIRSDLGGRALIPYVISLDGGNPQRITTNTDGLGRIVPNFRAKTLANVRRGTTTTSRVLEVMNLEGENRKQVFSGDKLTINDIDLSDNGEYIAYTIQAQDTAQNGLYRAKLSGGSITPEKIVSKPNLLMFDVSASGDRLLYTTSDNAGITDLYMYTVSTGQDTLVRKAMKGSQYQFKSGKEDQFLFFDLRDGGSNVYLLDLKDNSETRLTTFGAQEGVEAVYQQPGLILYQTNRGLYAMDENKFISGKLVTTLVARFTGYDF